MRKFRVVSFIDPMHTYNPLTLPAMHMREQYGLFYLTIDEVMVRWRQFSQLTIKSDWANPTASAVSKVFGVKLEEV